MLDFPPWKIAFVLMICFIGALAAFPNFLTDEQVESLPGFLPSSKVTLGLDLQGGSHMLLEVDSEAVVTERMANLEGEVRDVLRRLRIIANISTTDRTVRVRLRDVSQLDEARKAIADLAAPVGEGSVLGGSFNKNINVDAEGEGVILVTLTEAAISERLTKAVEQSLEIVRRRVDEMGTREPTIQRQGAERILLQVPGLQDSGQLRSLLETTAKMTFHMVNASADPSRPPPGYMTVPSVDGEMLVLERRARLTGENLVDASVGFNENSQPVVNFRFDSTGGRRFADITRENVNKRFAIVLDDEIISAPNIQSPILGGAGQIFGNFTVESANELAILLRAGALPAPLTIMEERTVGPDLGQDSVEAGEIAGIIGLVGVVIFMMLVYGWFGLAANIALMINIFMLMGALSTLGATLTLPGIAGIVLTVGMAVDANVLVFERIREEHRAGRSPLTAVQAGYERALSTILDANITTFIAATILYLLGSGPVKGFAVTLAIGIVTSVFTAFVITRWLTVMWLKGFRPRKLAV
jgi:protein-export membrane protein SecD